MVQWAFGVSKGGSVWQHPRPNQLYVLQLFKKKKDKVLPRKWQHTDLFWSDLCSFSKKSNAWKVLVKSTEGKVVADKLLAWSRKPVKICVSHKSFFRKRYSCELWVVFWGFFFDPRVSQFILAYCALEKLLCGHSSEECKIQPGKEEQWFRIQGSNAFILPQKMLQAVMEGSVLWTLQRQFTPGVMVSSLPGRWWCRNGCFGWGALVLAGTGAVWLVWAGRHWGAEWRQELLLCRCTYCSSGVSHAVGCLEMGPCD